MKLSYRNLLLGLIITGSTLASVSSCRKEIRNDGGPSKKHSLISATMVVDQSWINLRNKAKNEFDFYFKDYYHTRDFLKEVDWNQAILNEDHGKKVMVFLFKTDATIKTDARLMVIQDMNGNNHYSVRIKSKAINGYASIFDANNKVLTIGTIQNDGSFDPITQTELKTTGVPGGSICYTCHRPDDDDDWGGNPGEDGINGDNWLDDVVIQDQATTNPPYIIPWPYWEGPWFVLPPVVNGNVDDNPCLTFNSLMNNPTFRTKLQQLLNNTTLNRETAFTFNGSSFSPFAYGPEGGNGVDIFVPGDGMVHGHSHYTLGQYGTFSPQDLYGLYQIGSAVNNPMNFTSVIATPGGGVSMIKIVNHNQFNSFANSWMPNGDYSALEALYNSPQYNVGTGADATSRLRNLLDALGAGLKIQHIPNPGQGASGNPCE